MIHAESRKVFLALCLPNMTLLFLGLLVLGGCAAGGSAGGGGGGGGSNPVPGIVALDPAAVATGGPDYYMSVYGTGFVASSIVEWNGSKLPTTFVNDRQVFALVGAANRITSATVPVTVFNTAPGGGISNAVSVLVGPAPPPPPGVGVLQLVSVAPDGTPGNGASYTPPALSANGRFVAFQSDSTNLVLGPASGFTEIFVRDTCLGVTSGCMPFAARVSVANDGTLPNGNSRSPAISASGRYVAFDSSASNLVPNDTNGKSDVFLRDTCIGALAACVPIITRISVASDGSQANDDSRNATISADGRFVAFNSVATNLVPNDTNGWLDIFLRDSCLGAPAGCAPSTTRVSVGNDGGQSNAPSAYPSMSADGRYISFRMAGASNLVPNDPNASVILHDTCFGASASCMPSNRSLFVSYTGDTLHAAVDSLWILSSNARYSGFGAGSSNNNLVPGNTGRVDAYVYDDCIGAPTPCIPHTDRVSVTYNGGEADSGSVAAVSSDDGNYVAFISIATNLLPYAYRSSAVYVRMTCANAPAGCVPTTYLLSVDSNTGIQGNTSYSDYPAITPDGRYVVFLSNAANWPGKLQSNGKNQIWLARVY